MDYPSGYRYEDRDQREERVKQHLDQARITPYAHDDDIAGRLESGHRYYVSLHQDTGRWHIQAWHPGDPSGSVVLSDLGQEDPLVAGRVADQFRRPALVKALGEQWQRAMAAGDPQGSQGLYHQSKWHGVSHHFHDYGGG